MKNSHFAKNCDMTFSAGLTVSTFFMGINIHLLPVRENVAEIKTPLLGKASFLLGSENNIIFPFAQSDNLNIMLLIIFLGKAS